LPSSGTVVAEILGTLVGINFGATFLSVAGMPEGGDGVARVTAVDVVVIVCPPAVVVIMDMMVEVTGAVE
jgi:hypothetical protein